MEGAVAWSQLGVKGLKETGDDQAGKSRGKGVALREAILLEKEIKGAIRAVKVAAVGIRVHESKIMKQGVETGFGLKDVFAFVPRHLVPAVHKVNEQAGMGGGLVGLERFGDKSVILTMG